MPKLLLILTVAILLTSALWAQPAKLLALYKSSEKDSPSTSLIARYAQSLLAAQGYALDYHDIDSGFPTPEALQQYRGLISWYRGPQMSRAKDYPAWLAQQILAGRKVIILGNFGAYTPDGRYFTPPNYLNEALRPLGLRYQGQWTNQAQLLQIVTQDTSVVQADLKSIAHYTQFASTNSANRPFLVVRRSDLPKSESALVVATPHGGMASEGYLYRGDPERPEKWYLDLGAFLKACLQPAAAATPLPSQRLLALYKSSETEDAFNNDLRRYAAESLFELGYQLDYWDIDSGRPSEAQMQPYRALLTWYKGATMSDAGGYASWLSDNLKSGRKVIILGNYGAFQDRIQGTKAKEDYFRWLGLEEYNNFLSPFGLEFQRNWTNDVQQLQVVSKDPAMVEYQLPLTKEDVKHYFKFVSVSSANRPYLVVRRSDMRDSDSPIIAKTAGGGLALEGYLFESKAPDYLLRWRLNLPEFLKETLQGPVAASPKVMLESISEAELSALPAQVPLAPFPRYSNQHLPQAPEVSRKVLALYKSSEKDSSDHNLIHQKAEQVLEHLGLRVSYHDVDQGLPSPAEMATYRGIITWYHDSSMPDPQGYVDWLLAQMEAGRRLAILGEVGCRYQSKTRLVSNAEARLFQALGMQYQDQAIEDPYFNRPVVDVFNGNRKGGLPGSSILYKDTSMCEFEVPLDLGDIRDLSRIRSISPDNKVFLSLKVPRWGQVDPVVITPRGGIADRDFCFFEPLPATINPQEVSEEPDSPGRWRIDPYRFFSQSLALQGLPRPDATTLNGSRIFYSHIDGDGFPGISLIDRNSLASEFIDREVFGQYPLPFTVSVIAKDMERRAQPHYNREVELARRVFARPNVEAASHSWTHPFNWRQGDLQVVKTEPEVELNIQPTDLTKQITYSINYINRHLLPPNKRVEVMLWTGNCRPSPEAIATTVANGVRNLNGGDPVYDAEHPSYSTLCPLTAQVGNQVQYYTSGRGEFLYTDGWTKNFDGQKKLVDHFHNTESPRRVMPMNLYFHFYVGDRQLGLESIRTCLDYVLGSQPAPLFASQYLDIVSDWLGMRLFAKGDGWVVVNSGKCRTVRFDDCRAAVDLARSQGVLGFRHLNGALYVHLDEQLQHEIYLSQQPARGVYLEQASHYLDHWRVEGSAIQCQLFGLGPAAFAIAGLPPGRSYQAQLLSGDGKEERWSSRVTCDASGRLHLKTQLSGPAQSYQLRIVEVGS